MKSCDKCDCAVAATVLPEYLDDLMGSGMPIALVNSVTEFKCSRCSDVKISIPDFGGLVAAIALSRSMHPLKLRSSELRFLRKALELSSKDFAACIGVSAETVSRWENNREPIKAPVEKLIRLMAGVLLSEQAPAISFDGKAVADMRLVSVCSDQNYPPMRFGRTKVRVFPKPAEPCWDRLGTAA